MKKINVKPIEIIKIEFEDGTFKECKFSARAMKILDEEYDGFLAVMESAEKKPFLAGSKLLYAGMKASNEETTIQDAKTVVGEMSVNNIMDLFDYAAESMEIKDREPIEVEEEKKPMVPQDHKKKKKWRKKK